MPWQVKKSWPKDLPFKEILATIVFTQSLSAVSSKLSQALSVRVRTFLGIVTKEEEKRTI